MTRWFVTSPYIIWQLFRWLHASCDKMNTEDDAERMSNIGYHCLFCRPKTGTQSPRPPTPEPQTPLSIASPVSVPPPPPPKERQKLYSVDGVYLSENGLGLIKELTLEPPATNLSNNQRAAQAARIARNRQMKIKQSHPQMSHLLSVASSTTGNTSSHSLNTANWHQNKLWAVGILAIMLT